MTQKIIAVAMVLTIMGTTQMCGKKKYVPERGDYSFRTELVTKMVDGFDNPQAVDIITYVTDKQTTDTLHSEPIPLDSTQWQGFGDIREDDINFDGFPDLLVCLGPFNYAGNFTYDAFVWDNKAHKFVNVPEFSQIFDPEIIADKRKIYGGFRLDNDLDIQEWEWRDGKLTLIEERHENISDLLE